MHFGSHVDGVVAVAAALVNAATAGHRQGRKFTPPTGAALADELGAALGRGRTEGRPPPANRVRPFVELADDLRPVFEAADAADQDRAVATVNTLLARYTPVPHLERHDGEPWHLHFHGARACDPSGWGASTSLGLATVLGSEYADRLGVCAAEMCDRVFVDVSRNGTRRFCSEACQNRVKAAAHRARQRG